MNERLWDLFIELMRIIEVLFNEIDEMEIMEKILNDEQAYEMIRRLLAEELEIQKATLTKKKNNIILIYSCLAHKAKL